MELVGGNFHGLPCGAWLARLRVLPHTGVLQHVEQLGLIVSLEVEDKGVGRTVAQVLASGVVLCATGYDGLQYGILRPHVEIASWPADVYDGRSANLDVHITFRLCVLNGVVRLELHGQLICGKSAVRLINRGVQKYRLPWISLDGSAGTKNVSRIVSSRDDVHIGLQLKLIAGGVVVSALRCARGLQGAECHYVVGVGLSGLLVKCQRVGGDVNRVLQFLRLGLIGLRGTLSVTLQIDVHFANGIDVTALRIVGELLAVDLIETVMRFSVHDDVHVLQIGVSTRLELHGVRSANGENRASAFGF